MELACAPDVFRSAVMRAGEEELGYTFLYPTMKEGLKALYVLEDHPWGKKY